MSHRVEEKEARRQARLEREREAARRQGRARALRAAGAAVALLLLAVAVVVAAGQSAENGSGKARVVGGKSAAPDFAALDVVSNRMMRLQDLDGKPTLLFFSEGASCQACLVQIAELESAKELATRGVDLVSVTTDEPDVLRDVAQQYRIETPLLSDSSTRMSADYGMLGHGGMGHQDTDGHAFALVKNGRVVWHKAYAEMFVPTKKLMNDMDRRVA